MVVELHVQDHRDLGPVTVEAAVALVRLGDEQVPGARLRVRPGDVQVAADGVGRRQAQVGQGHGQHRGGRGLAVRPGHRDRPQAGHQCGQRLGAVHGRDAAPGGLGELRIVRADGAGDHHAARVLRQVTGGVPDADLRAERAQRGDRLGVPRVAARDPGAAAGQNLGDPRHARSADADEVRPVHRGRDRRCHGEVSLVEAWPPDCRTRRRPFRSRPGGGALIRRGRTA